LKFSSLVCPPDLGLEISTRGGNGHSFLLGGLEPCIDTLFDRVQILSFSLVVSDLEQKLLLQVEVGCNGD